MIQLVMKPEKAPVMNREGLYGMYMNGNLLLHVRARNARHTEEKVKFLMEHETMGFAYFKRYGVIQTNPLYQ